MKISKILLSIVCSSMLFACSSGNSSSLEPSSSGSLDSSSISTTIPVHGITWEGVEDTVAPLGDAFDLLEGVHAYDGIDGELEVTIEDDDYFSSDFEAGYTITYSATNSVQTTSTVTRSIQVIRGVNVYNGNFSSGKTYWTFDKPGGNGTFSIKNSAAYIAVTDPGTEAWAIQLYQSGISFEAGKSYEMTFQAKSSSGRAISAGFENVSNNYAMLVSGYQALTLTSEYQTYSVIASISADISLVKAVIYLGYNLSIDDTATSANPIDCTIDNIKVREVNLAPIDKAPTFQNAGPVTVSTKDQFDALPQVTAKDYLGQDITSSMTIVGEVPSNVNAQTGMMISYRVSDSEGNFGFVNRRVGFVIAKDHPYNLINADFDNGFQGWTKDVNQTNGNGNANFSSGDSKATIEIVSGSSDGWHIQLWQQNVSITSGQIYRITLIAKADVARTVVIEVSNPSNSFARVVAETLNLTTEFQTFTVEFKATISFNAKYSILLGGQGSNVVTIDKFENQQITAGEATQVDPRSYEDWQIVNSDFKYGSYGFIKEASNGALVEFGTNLSSQEVTLNVVTPGSQSWHAQLAQDGKIFSSGITYTLTLRAKVNSGTTSIDMEVTNNNGDVNIAKKAVTLTSEYQDFTMTFTPEENYSRGKIALLIGKASGLITVDSLVITKD